MYIERVIGGVAKFETTLFFVGHHLVWMPHLFL